MNILLFGAALALASFTIACDGETESPENEVFFDLDHAVELADAALVDVEDLTRRRTNER